MITLIIPELFGVSIEVYFIVAFLAAPMFFFWRWIFKNRIQDNRARLIVIWITTLFTAPLLYATIAFIILYCMFYYPNRDFDKKQWLADKEKRYEFANDIINSKLLVGKTKTEVIQLLGDEGNSQNTGDNFSYYMGYKPEIGNIDPTELEIEFNNGIVTDVSIHH